MPLHAVLLLDDRHGNQTSRPPFPADDRFDPYWWQGASQAPCHWLSIRDGDQEAARAKMLPDYEIGGDYEHDGAPPTCARIDLIEVRPDLRRQGIGTRAVEAIGVAYPGKRMCALSLNDDADRFWSTLGWDDIDPGEGQYVMFVSR